MNRLNRYIPTGLTLWAVCALTVLSGACSAYEETEGTDGSPEPIRFAAQASAPVASRADGGESDGDGPEHKGKYVEEGAITHGQFCLGYESSANDAPYRVADVNFDNGPLAGTGIGTVWTPEGYKELSWSGVRNTNTPIFYMDNVLKKYNEKWKPDHSSGEHDSEILFKAGEHPFVAGLFDYVDGENDLLWGSDNIPKNTNPIVMNLHHRMSIVRVEITVDRTAYPEQAIDLSEASISITNLVHTPRSFNRKDGTIAIADNPVREDLVMVDTKKDENSERNWKNVVKGYEEEIESDDEPGKTRIVDIYTTKDFVLPPQGLPERENRPRLRIETADRVFSGILPNAMWEMVDDKPTNPLTLRFMEEHKLTIRTRITLDPPELTFMPVLVRDWVCKDVHVSTGYQAGLYTAGDFQKLATVYGTKYNVSTLSKYGYIKKNGDKNGAWVFGIYRTLTLKYDDIKGTMKPGGSKLDFSFSLARYKVYVVKDGETYLVNAETLKEIVSTDSWEPTQEPVPGA